MKKLGIAFATLICAVSVVCAADVATYLQVKKNSMQEQGITYTVIFPSDYEGGDKRKFTISERGNSKLFESEEYGGNKYLLSDNKMYQLPVLPESSKVTLLSATVLPEDAKDDIEEDFKSFLDLNYKELELLNRGIANGYQCQVAEKVVSEKKMLDEYNKPFTVQRVLKFYIAEQYGYPTRVEHVIRSKYKRETEWKSAVQKKETVDIIDFSNNISKKMLTLPKNTFIINSSNMSSFNENEIKQQYLQKLKEQYDQD